MPPEKCTICRHAKRAAIEAAARESGDLLIVAQSFGVSRLTLRRHIDAHAGEDVQRAIARPGAPPEPDDLERLESLWAMADAMLKRATTENSGATYRDTTDCIKAATRLLVEIAKHRRTGEIDESRIVASAAWKRVMAKLAAALAPFPEAARAAATALEEM